MKKPLALLLISIMVLMLSAFSFADDGYSLKIMEPKKSIADSETEEPFFITIWVKANIDDVLESLDVTILDEDGDNVWSDDDVDVDYEFTSKIYKYTFEAVDFTPIDEFEIFVVASFDDDEIGGVEDSKIVKIVTDKENDDDEDEDDEEDMDDDMYPAAPAVANMLLKEAGIPNRVEGVNLIALVAGEMNEEEPFGLDEIEDLEDLEAAVDGFLVDQLNDLLGKTHDDLADFTDHFVGMEKTVGKPEVEKMKPQQLDDDDDNDNDDDDEDDDDDNDDDDDDNDNKGENPGKGNKK